MINGSVNRAGHICFGNFDDANLNGTCQLLDYLLKIKLLYIYSQNFDSAAAPHLDSQNAIHHILIVSFMLVARKLPLIIESGG